MMRVLLLQNELFLTSSRVFDAGWNTARGRLRYLIDVFISKRRLFYSILLVEFDSLRQCPVCSFSGKIKYDCNFEDVSLVEFMYPVFFFNRMSGGVIVGDSGSLLLLACVQCVTSIVRAQLYFPLFVEV